MRKRIAVFIWIVLTVALFLKERIANTRLQLEQRKTYFWSQYSKLGSSAIQQAGKELIASYPVLVTNKLSLSYKEVIPDAISELHPIGVYVYSDMLHIRVFPRSYLLYFKNSEDAFGNFRLTDNLWFLDSDCSIINQTRITQKKFVSKNRQNVYLNCRE